jgi:hypothetical protein
MKSSGIRKLAAIMFTDMVGYKALMQKDESRAKANRDRHRKVLELSIKKNSGTILLEEALKQNACVYFIKIAHIFKEIRMDSRFSKLMHKYGYK